MRAPERDSTPIARPYFLAWLASGTDDYDKNTIESSPRWFASEDPAGEVAQVPASLISDPATGKLWKANSSGVIEEVGSLAGAQSWTGLQTFEAHARLIDASALQFGTPGTDLVLTPNGTDVIVTGTGDLVVNDSVDLYLGTGKDFRQYHDGTNTYMVSATGNWIRDNTLATGATYDDLGTDTNATEWAVRNNSGTRLLKVTGDGGIDLGTAWSMSSAGVLSQNDGSILLRKGRGAGAGDVIERIGLTATEGYELVVYEGTISPAAVETAILTIPARSRVRCVQANCEAALTGGGTTATWSVGTAGDPDKYGTAGNGAGDTLAKNSKVDFIPADAFLTSTEDVVLTGVATGGAADGDTALTVGAVRVRVIYETLNSLDDAP